MLSARTAGKLASRLSTTAFKGRPLDQEVQEIAHNLSERIASNSEACASFTEHLDDASRHQLILALAASKPSLSAADKQRLDLILQEHLLEEAARQPKHGMSELDAALKGDSKPPFAESQPKQTQPSSFSIALANSIPFIGMGAVDNAIMLMAGSQIDAVFGAKLGLSTLAAAGLGNMVSDIAGVSMANRLDDLTRKSTWVNQLAYKAGTKTPKGRAAKLMGAVIGVSVGCVIGMAPLIFMDTHEYDDPAVHGVPASQ